MTFYTLQPEVAGGWGDHTIADVSVHPPVVTWLHCQLDGWLGDDLLESFPCYIVTDRLAERLRRSGLQGFQLATVEISRSEQFEEMQPGTELPPFQWLQPVGAAGVDDFGMSPDHILVVSGRAWEVLREFQLQDCAVKEWPATDTPPPFFV